MADREWGSYKDWLEGSGILEQYPELELMTPDEQQNFLESKGLLRAKGGRVGYMGGGIMNARVGMQTGGTPPTYEDILTQLQGSTANMEQQSMSLPSPQVQALQGVMGPMMAKQIGTPIETSAFAPSAAPQTGLQQQAAQQAATQAGLGKLTFDPDTGQLIDTGAGDGIAGYQKY